MSRLSNFGGPCGGIGIVLVAMLSVWGSGCSDGGGGGGGKKVSVAGKVVGGSPVAGATVAFVEAFGALARESVQPVEDLAATAAVRVTTDAQGAFSAEVRRGRYFVFVIPAAGDARHHPGGSLSRRSIDLDEGEPGDLQIVLSEKPSPAARFVGSSTCLGCHAQYASAKGTLHFVGFRRLTAAGSETTSLQDLSGFPQANGALAFFADGNPADNTGSPADGYGYRVPTDAGYSVLLGKDGTGYFQAMEDPGGAVSSRLYIVFTYGGEGVYRHRFITRLDAEGKYTEVAPAGSYYVLPAQYSETTGEAARGDVTVPAWVTFRPGDWGPPASEGASPSVTPVPERSFDNQCAGCHFTGMALTRNVDGLFQAHAVSDPGGSFDYDGDGSVEEINIGCERCHGPGSEHAGAFGGGPIVQPEYLPPGRAVMICGQCHTYGNGNGTIDGAGQGTYASRNSPTTGEIEFVRAGLSPAEFFGQPDGTGILPDFGSTGGFYSPVNLATSPASWQDRSGGFGAPFDHSRSETLQSIDIFRAAHFQNPYEILACFDCHDPHARTQRAQARAKIDNNQICLGCHAGQGDFSEVTDEDVAALAGAGPQPASISSALSVHVTNRTFEQIGVAMNLGSAAYSLPAGSSALGRCVTCHMPKTAMIGHWIQDDEGYTIRGDISSHTFDAISPEVSEAMATAGKEPVPNSCAPCHRGVAQNGIWPDYRYR